MELRLTCAKPSIWTKKTCRNISVQWDLYNETGKFLLKTHKFNHLPDTVSIKSCLPSLPWETTCLERPQNLVVALYRYVCQPDEPQASLATTNRCNDVYVVLFFILLFMYAVIQCLYSVGNKITTTTTTGFPVHYQNGSHMHTPGTPFIYIC